MAKTNNRPHEVVFATQRGVFFANIGKGQANLTSEHIMALEKTGQFTVGQSGMNPHQEASVFAQDLSQVNDTETDLNKPLETEPSFMMQTQSNINESKENPLNDQEPEERKSRTKKVAKDQDSELPQKRKRTKNSPSQGPENSRQSSDNRASGTKSNGPSLESSMQRTFNRRSPVKNSKGL